jgi:electron transfer flavoprotein alpha subunit
LRVIQETIGGTYLVESAIGRGTAVITMHPGAILVPTAPAVTAALPIIEHIHIDLPALTTTPRVLSRTAKRAAAPTPLDEADIVVAGGRGVGSAEGFGLLARIAAELGGRLGGTHTAEELGWCPAHARINLPGAQIRPRLYFAGGVSGSVRHRAAIRGAKTIVAIDRDPRAPIFRIADFGVVGDLKQVLPALLEEIRQRRTGSPVEPSDDNAEA